MSATAETTAEGCPEFSVAPTREAGAYTGTDTRARVFRRQKRAVGALEFSEAV